MKPTLTLVGASLVSALPAVAHAMYDQRGPGSPTDLNAGGLAPPPTSPYESMPPPPSPTEQQLSRADREDSGRGLEFFWLNGEIGFEHLGLQTFSANDLVDAELVETTQTGLTYGAGLGVRLVFLTAGARFRLGSFSDWQLWTLNLELGLRMPMGMVEPYFTFGGGYASVGAFDSGSIGAQLTTAGADTTGFNLRGGFGLDVYLSEAFSLGGNLSGDLMFLSRPKVEPADIPGYDMLPPQEQQAVQDVYSNDGSSVGAGVTLTAVVGLHF